MSRLRLIGVFSDQYKMVEAAHALKARGVEIIDIFTPFPVHGLDSILGIKRSRLPILCFFVAITAAVLATYFQVWSMDIDWPLNVGGKPFSSYPAFVPVTFEFMVLCSGLATVFAFFALSRLFPGKKAVILSPRVTDDQFVILANAARSQVDPKILIQMLKDRGATEADVKEGDL